MDALAYWGRGRLFDMAPRSEEYYCRNSESGLPEEPASMMISQGGMIIFAATAR